MLLSNFKMKLVNFKGYCQGHKGPMWTIVIYLGLYIRNSAQYGQCLFVAHISHISRSHTFKWLYLINGASYDQSLNEILILYIN